MTTLEARVLALESDILVLCQAIRNLTDGHTLFATLVSAQLRGLVESVGKLRDEHGGDEFEDFDA